MTTIAARVQSVRELLARSIEVKRALLEGDHAERLARIAQVCIDALSSGGKLMFCGNGGSAADAQHLAAELLVRLRSEVNREGLPAIALALDTSSMTACGNDYSYEVYYERVVRAVGRRGDVLIGISTSGRSPNIIRAFKAAREMGIATAGLLGGTGGPVLADSDLAIVVPSSETGRIQEGHITLGHALMEMIEDGLIDCGHIQKSALPLPA